MSPPNFSALPQEMTFAAFLFDMDGTLIDSTAAITRHWRQLGADIGVDPAAILATSHGRRSIDTLALYAPHLATWDFVSGAEAAIPRRYGADAVEIPGSRALLDALGAAGVPWAVVTSGTRGLVSGWLEVMGLARPRTLVTAEEVARGKPDPAGYRLGAERLGMSRVSARKVCVVEDAPAGVRAGVAAGFAVVAVATTHGVDQLVAAGADWVVRDLRSVVMKGYDGQKGTAVVEIRDALVLEETNPRGD